MTIDMHAHFIPTGLLDMLRARPAAPRLERHDDGRDYIHWAKLEQRLAEGVGNVDKRLSEMDKHGVRFALLSNQLQDMTCLPLADAVPLCGAFNDAISEICTRHPDRFAALAALPVADIAATIAELERAMALPGIIGIILPGDGFLSARRAEQFRPVLESLDRHQAMMLVHYARLANDPEAPRVDASDNRRIRMATLDMQARISSNMITFCLTDFLSAFPNLTVMSHNLGGNIPFEVERLDHRTMNDSPGDELPSKRIRAARIIVDCNSLGARSIERAIEVYGAEKIVFGSDGTGFGMGWSQSALDEARITETEKRAIRESNAASLLARIKGGRSAVAAQ